MGCTKRLVFFASFVCVLPQVPSAMRFSYAGRNCTTRPFLAVVSVLFTWHFSWEGIPSPAIGCPEAHSLRLSISAFWCHQDTYLPHLTGLFFLPKTASQADLDGSSSSLPSDPSSVPCFHSCLSFLQGLFGLSLPPFTVLSAN